MCSNPIKSDKAYILVDGVVLTVCKLCSKRGKAVNMEKEKNTSTRILHGPRLHKISLSDQTILVENFASVIRLARMKKGLSHEQLGSQLKEKSSMLKKLETGSLKPNEILAKKIERFLGIKLYENIENSS